MVDDIDIVIVVVSNTAEEILQCNEAKQETMYDRIEGVIKGVQLALYLNCAMSTKPLSAGDAKVGDEPAQLCISTESTKDHLRRVQKEKEQAT
jgi:Na+/phosphate symporter